MVTSQKVNLSNNSANDIKWMNRFKSAEKKANTSLQHFRPRAVRQQPETMLHADSLSHVWSLRQTREVILHKHLTKKVGFASSKLSRDWLPTTFSHAFDIWKGWRLMVFPSAETRFTDFFLPFLASSFHNNCTFLVFFKPALLCCMWLKPSLSAFHLYYYTAHVQACQKPGLDTFSYLFLWLPTCSTRY